MLLMCLLYFEIILRQEQSCVKNYGRPNRTLGPGSNVSVHPLIHLPQHFIPRREGTAKAEPKVVQLTAFFPFYCVLETVLTLSKSSTEISLFEIFAGQTAFVFHIRGDDLYCIKYTFSVYQIQNPTEDPPRLTWEISGQYFSPFKLSSLIAQSVFHDKLYVSLSHFRKPRVSHKHPQCKATDPTKAINSKFKTLCR